MIAPAGPPPLTLRLRHRPPLDAAVQHLWASLAAAAHAAPPARRRSS